MFVRKKNNRSGSVSVVVVSKQSGIYKEIHTVGVSSNNAELAKLVQQGRDWIMSKNAMLDMFESD